MVSSLPHILHSSGAARSSSLPAGQTKPGAIHVCWSKSRKSRIKTTLTQNPKFPTHQPVSLSSYPKVQTPSRVPNEGQRPREDVMEMPMSHYDCFSLPTRQVSTASGLLLGRKAHTVSRLNHGRPKTSLHLESHSPTSPARNFHFPESPTWPIISTQVVATCPTLAEFRWQTSPLRAAWDVETQASSTPS